MHAWSKKCWRDVGSIKFERACFLRSKLDCDVMGNLECQGIIVLELIQSTKSWIVPWNRNPIEGKFGQAKTAYGLDRIYARLSSTSESWIASIILVLNLVHLAEVALCCLNFLSIKNRIKIYLYKFVFKYQILMRNVAWVYQQTLIK